MPETVFQTATTCLILLTRDGIVLDANPSALELGALRIDEVAGRPLWAAGWWHERVDAQAAVRAACERAADGERTRCQVVAGRHDAPCLLDLVVSPRRDTAGAPTSLLVEAHPVGRPADTAVVRNDNDALYRAVVDGQTELVSRFLADGTFVFANDAYCRFFGKPAELLLGKRWQPVAHPDDVAHVEAELAKMTPNNPIVVIENRVHDAAGRVRWCEFVNRGFYGPDGALSEVQSIGRDITRRREGEAERRRIQLHLQERQRLESLGILAGGVAHDFNNILACIMTSATLLRCELPPGSPGREFIEEIEVAVARAADLSRQMLAYAGRGPIARAPSDLTALVRDSLSLVRPATGRGVTLELTLDTDLPPVLGDETQLRQVLLNLVFNAVEACEPRGVVEISTGRVRADAATLATYHAAAPLPPGEYVSLSVRDDGVGMPPEVRVRAFEPFFSTKANGRGLGLAATLGIVHGHDAGISVDSELGRGTTVSILFPVFGTRGA